MNGMALPACGFARLRQAWRAIHDNGIMTLLAHYRPLLAGSLPLAVDVAGSDVDILCQAENLAGFGAAVDRAFGGYAAYDRKRKRFHEVDSVVARFEHRGLVFEMFAQPVAVTRQAAFLHMVAEARLLDLCGEALRVEVRRLKGAGLGTEPAFARALGLTGDAYAVLLRLADAPRSELVRLVGSAAARRC